MNMILPALLALAVGEGDLVDVVQLTDSSHAPHATLFVAPELVAPPGERSRLTLRTLEGRMLYTETHEVFRAARGSVVLVVGYSDPQVSGVLEVARAAAEPRRHLELFDPSLVRLAAGTAPGAEQLALEIDGRRQVLAGRWRVDRASSVLLRLFQHVDDLGGTGISAHVWLELEAGPAPRARLIVQLHRGLLPIGPDAYFRQVDLVLPEGWRWSGELPDAVHAGGHVVAPPADEDAHECLPRTRQRELRLVLEPAVAARQGEGWGVASWRRAGGLLEGGFGPTGVGMAERSGELRLAAQVEAAHRWAAESASLAAAGPDPHEGRLQGVAPPSAFWPFRGVLYGGMTGGIDVDAYEGALAVLSATRTELLRLRVEALRYGCRMHGWLYHQGGEPVAFAEALRPDGRLPSSYSGNRFLGADPFGVLAAEASDPVDGLCPHEVVLGVANLSFQAGAIDAQHGIRLLGALEALALLDDDPLARLRISAQAVLWAWENLGRWGPPPLGGGAGTYTGRGEAWGARAAALALGLARGGPTLGPWRAQLVAMVDHLRAAQRPCGLIMRREGGKVATVAPMGHKRAEPCPAGVHEQAEGDQREVVDLAAGRPGEDVFLAEALLAAEWVAGIPSRDVRQGIARGIRDYAWAFRGPGQPLSGWGDRVAVAPALEGGGWGEPFGALEDVPSWARWQPYGDGYDVPVVVALGSLEGVPMGLSLLRWTGTRTWEGARSFVLSRAMVNLEQGALLLAVVQSIP